MAVHSVRFRERLRLIENGIPRGARTGARDVYAGGGDAD